MLNIMVCNGFTSRKQGFGSGQIRAIVPVMLRTGTNVSISPGSSGQDAGQASAGISPGSTGTFSPGSRHQPRLKGLAPFSPGWCLQPGLKVSLQSRFQTPTGAKKMPIYILAHARPLLCFLAVEGGRCVCYSVLTSYAHEVFDEMPEPHLSFLLCSSSKLDLQAQFSPRFVYIWRCTNYPSILKGQQLHPFISQCQFSSFHMLSWVYWRSVCGSLFDLDAQFEFKLVCTCMCRVPSRPRPRPHRRRSPAPILSPAPPW